MELRSLIGRGPTEILAASKFQQAFALLLEASEYAKQTKCNLWEYAVEIHRLRSLGLSDNDLRFLVRSQYLEHAGEITAVREKSRCFRSSGEMVFAKRTCFVLTRRGTETALGDLRDASEHDSIGLPTNHVSQVIPRLGKHCLPIWDANRRILSWEGQVVKQFRRAAFNQERILLAFQEEEWPLRIFDPLAPQPCQDTKRRLNATIKCLNHGQENSLLHFRGDGTGEGVIWETAV
jgi:hypothetical protein